MKPANPNRSRIIGLRLTQQEYEQIEKKFKASTCRQLSEYVRRSLFNKPIVTTYRNQSFDNAMTEMIKLRNELNSIGNNINQAVKKLHTLNQIQEFRSWILHWEFDKKMLENKVDEIKFQVNKMADKWLQ